MNLQAKSSQHKLALRASTANPGYSVKQSEETIKNLRKENFNLKLKMYLMKGKSSVLPKDSGEKAGEKELVDLLMENEFLRIELDDNQSLLKASLDAILKVEDQKAKYQKKYEDLLVEYQMQTVKTSKVGTLISQ